MNDVSELLTLTLSTTLRMSVAYILASTGASFSMRAGVVDLGCEGMMITGSFFAVVGTFITQNIWLGLLTGMLAGVAISMLHAVLSVNFKVNQTISGMCVNMLGIAMTPLLIQVFWGVKGNTPTVPNFENISSPFIESIPFIGPILVSQNILFYLTIVLVIIAHIFMFKTAFGLRMRMVGENPQAANTVGLNVVRYKFFGVAMSGAFCGLAGAYLSIGQLNLFVDGMTAGRGYIAIVINALGQYSPIGALLSSLFFGFFESLQVLLQGFNIPSNIVMMTPYVVTLLLVSFGMRTSHTPAGVGKHHNV